MSEWPAGGPDAGRLRIGHHLYVTVDDDDEDPKRSAMRLFRVAWQAELATDCVRLAAVKDGTALQDEASQRIHDTRRLLKLHI